MTPSPTTTLSSYNREGASPEALHAHPPAHDQLRFHVGNTLRHAPYVAPVAEPAVTPLNSHHADLAEWHAAAAELRYPNTFFEVGDFQIEVYLARAAYANDLRSAIEELADLTGPPELSAITTFSFSLAERKWNVPEPPSAAEILACMVTCVALGSQPDDQRPLWHYTLTRTKAERELGRMIEQMDDQTEVQVGLIVYYNPR